MVELLERGGEEQAVADAVARAIAGEGPLVVVRGPAGIGKTSILAIARERAQAAGLRVLDARGGALERDLVYGIARQLFERPVIAMPPEERERLLAGAARHAGAVLGLEPLHAPADGGTLDHGLFWLVSNLTEHGPLLLLVDDAHWADTASLGFLVHLARRLAGLPVLLVVAARANDSAPLVDRLVGEPGATLLEPAPLGLESAARLLREGARGDLTDAAVRAGHDVTGGNPFFLVEVGDALAATPSADAERTVRALVPSAVRHALLLRLGALGDDARAVANALSVLGDGTEIATLAGVAGRPAAQVLRALEALGVAGLTARTQLTAFAHPIVRTAIHADLGAPARALLHARAARVLAAGGAAEDRVAHHLLRTEPAGNAIDAAVLAGAGAHALAQGDSGAAAELLSRALREPCPPALMASVQADLGRAHLGRSELDQARAVLTAALAGERRPDRRVRVALDLANALAADDAIADAVDVLRGAAAELDGRRALRLRAQASSLALFDPARALEAQVEIHGFAALPGENVEERFALASASLVAAFDPAARADAALAIALRALGDGQLVAEATDPTSSVGPPLYALALGGAFDAGDAELRNVLARARRRASPGEFLLYEAVQADVDRQRGRLVAAAAHCASAMTLARDWSAGPVSLRTASIALLWLVEILLEQGKPEDAVAAVAGFAGEHDLGARPELVWARQAEATLAAHAGDHAAALEGFEAVGRVAAAFGYEDRTTPWRPGAARAAAALGDSDAALVLTAKELELCRTWGAPGPLSTALRARANTGPATLAQPLLEEAVRVTANSPARLAAARATLDLGLVQRRVGARTQARATLERAADIAAACGALATAERARAELVVLGARPRRHRISGVDALTPSERRVCDLAATGMTNREIGQELFVTRKTVEAHLGHVYRKLGVAGREELAAALAD